MKPIPSTEEVNWKHEWNQYIFTVVDAFAATKPASKITTPRDVKAECTKCELDGKRHLFRLCKLCGCLADSSTAIAISATIPTRLINRLWFMTSDLVIYWRVTKWGYKAEAIILMHSCLNNAITHTFVPFALPFTRKCRPNHKTNAIYANDKQKPSILFTYTECTMAILPYLRYNRLLSHF